MKRTLICLALLVASASVPAQMSAYTKPVKSVELNGVNFEVGMTSDELMRAAERAHLEEAGEFHSEDTRLPGNMLVVKFYGTGENGLKVELRHQTESGPYVVSYIAVSEKHQGVQRSVP